MADNVQETIEELSPIERKIIPYLNLPVEKIKEKTEIDNTTLLRALNFLENKNILKLKIEKNKIIELGTNGVYYKKTHLPERSLLNFLEKNNHVSIEEAQKDCKLSENEFKVSLGILKSKNFIELKNGKISITAKKEEITKKSLEEHLISALPLEEAQLQPEQKYAIENLKKRKDIIEIKEKQVISFELTELGKKIISVDIKTDLIEEVTPEIIKNWKRGKKFRKYDITTKAPLIYGGKKHFVNQAIEYAKRIWLDLGFKEMSGSLTQTSFWNFDALFTAQDHPVREMQDTFFIKRREGTLPQNEIVEKIKSAHEKGVDNSRGWQYSWHKEEAQKVVLRTHTTALSSKTLSSLKKSDLPQKFFAIGKCFRNETVDWSHGFEFNQTEGIVVDKNANFRHLLGYLKEFFKKMGFEDIKFVPSYFPYTEPSVEIMWFNKERGRWIELGGAGVFRPEVTVPLLGEKIPVLAWGPGFDRMIMDYYEIKDLRDMYANDIKSLREKKAWLK